MTIKFLSSTTAIGMLYVYLQSQLHSGDALFLVASSNVVINLLLLAVAGLAVKLSFSDKFQTWWSFLIAGIGSMLAVVVGLVGVIYTSFDNLFSGAFLPLDYLILLQLGVIYGLISVAYSHPPVNFKLPSYQYSIALARTKQQITSVMNRPIVIPGRRSSGHTAA